MSLSLHTSTKQCFNGSITPLFWKCICDPACIFAHYSELAHHLPYCKNTTQLLKFINLNPHT